MTSPYGPFGWPRYFGGETPVVFPWNYPPQPNGNNRNPGRRPRTRRPKEKPRLVSRDELREMMEHYDEFEQYWEDRNKRSNDKKKDLEKAWEEGKRMKGRKFTILETSLLFTLFAPVIGVLVTKMYVSGAASIAASLATLAK